jgi:hypothetical protein
MKRKITIEIETDTDNILCGKCEFKFSSCNCHIIGARDEYYCAIFGDLFLANSENVIRSIRCIEAEMED